MAARGVEVSHETVREWCGKFGAAYAKENPAAASPAW